MPRNWGKPKNSSSPLPGSISVLHSQLLKCLQGHCLRGAVVTPGTLCSLLCLPQLQHRPFCVLQCLNLLCLGYPGAADLPGHIHCPGRSVGVSQWPFPQAAGKCHSALPRLQEWPPQHWEHCLLHLIPPSVPTRLLLSLLFKCFFTFPRFFSPRDITAFCLLSQLWHLDVVIRWMSWNTENTEGGRLNILGKLKIPLVHQIQSSGA